jgi:hypothetical protein
MKKYSFQDYNDNNVLTVHWPLKLVLLYSLKHYLLALIPMSPSIPGLGMVLVDVLPLWIEDFAHKLSTTPLLLSSIPALLVVIAAVKRYLPTASEVGHLMRWSWRNGRWLVLLTILLETVIVPWYVFSGIKKLDVVILLVLYLDVIAVIFLLKSQRVRDVFAEFPQADDQAWLFALQENTLLAYQDYVSANTVKKHTEEAQLRMDELAWEQATKKDTAQSYQYYIDAVLPLKKHAREAHHRLEELLQQQREDEEEIDTITIDRE